MTSDNIAIKSTNFSVDKNGNMTCNSATVNNANITGGLLKLKDSSTTGSRKILVENETNSNIKTSIGTNGFNFSGERYNCYFLPGATSNLNQFIMASGDEQPKWKSIIAMEVYDNNAKDSQIYLMDFIGDTTSKSTTIKSSGISTPILNQTSLEESKKNFEKLEDALNIVKDIDIYKYNLKAEEDGTKKHIGFVIGDNYRYSKEVTSTENDGADIYSLASVCLKAIQELAEQNEQLQNEIKELKGEK